jgi:ubiquinone biosynthesis protein
MSRTSLPSVLVRRLNRFQHVANVLAKHGFGEALSRIRVWESFNIEKRFLKRPPKYAEVSIPQRLRMALEELGPTYIKLGQVLSTRPDLLPPEIIFELKKLQYSVHFEPTHVIRSTIETELGRPINEIFEKFDDTPLAAASLAQVHRAVLKGDQVVLKVQRPNIVESTEVDIEIMHGLASLAERYSPKLYLVNPVGLVEEFAQQIKKELDFRLEANNMRRFAQNFEKDETVHVPYLYPELCTRRVITMEFLDGICVSETARLTENGHDLKLIARRGAILAYKATFEQGFFHADPHPGNIFILPDNVIGLVDFGMMATLTLRDRERLSRLVYFISERDERRVARALNELMESEDIVPSEELEPSMTGIIQDYAEVPGTELLLAPMLFAMMRAIMAHGGRLRPQLLWLTKSIATEEELARDLGADFNMMELGRPFARKVLTQKLSPIHQSREIFYWLTDALDLTRDLPYDFGIVMRELRKGRIKIEFEHVGLEPIRRTMERMSVRTTLTNIIVALLVASSLIILAKVPPFVGNLSLLGFIGYLAAAVLGIVLAWSLLFGSRK